MADKKLTDVDLDTSIDESTDSVISDSNGSIMKVAFSTIKTWVTNIVNTILEAKNYLTEVPDEYVTDDELDGKGYLTEHQDLSGYAKTTDIPTTLPNPKTLTFTGAVTETYDGSSAVSIAIPEGGSGGSSDVLDLTEEQELTEEQQETVRTNISAAKVWLSDDGTTLYIESGGG